ncbi:MAG: hypothetical protein JSV26_00440 [bacterium]|nr:MAG: hypothetical protein JSV26_00440 [bacterium]
MIRIGRMGILAAALVLGQALAALPALADDVIPVKIEGDIVHRDGRYVFTPKKVIVLSQACDEIEGSLYRRSYELTPEEVKIEVVFQGEALKTLDRCRKERPPADKGDQ